MQAPFSSRRMQREARTVEAMIRRFCRDRHGSTPEQCQECRQLLAYAHKRLHHCPFQERKTTCANCPVHCYTPEHRARIKTVMQHSGPRMLFSHPILALLHLLDGLRKPRHRG